MRFIAFILSVLVLILSCLPCADDVRSLNDHSVKTELLKTHAQHGPGDHDDACSPFCHCACCAGFSINHTFASVSGIHLLSSNNFISYLQAAVIEISLPVWQPPQLIS